MSGKSMNEIDFEYWSKLASTDPEKFEQLRQDKISAIIEKSTSHRQKRLRGLQWQIDQIRDQHKDSATAACLAISGLMWETFEQLAELLQAQAENRFYTQTPVKQENIILFPDKRKTRIK